jgi:hypothetical protein
MLAVWRATRNLQLLFNRQGRTARVGRQGGDDTGRMRNVGIMAAVVGPREVIFQSCRCAIEAQAGRTAAPADSERGSEVVVTRHGAAFKRLLERSAGDVSWMRFRMLGVAIDAKR